MASTFLVREVIRASVTDRDDVTDDQIEAWAVEIEQHFGLEKAVALPEDESGEIEASRNEPFALKPNWPCIRCVSANIALSAAITTAIIVFGPASPGVVAFIAAKFGISQAIAAAAVGGLSGAALAKALCKVC